MRKSVLFLLAGFSLALFFALSCGTGDDPATDGNSGASAPPADPTWENYIQAFFDGYCVRCHSSDLTGSARQGAPAGIDYNTYELAVQNAAGAKTEVSSAGMPPSDPLPTDAERNALVKWVDNGTPQN
jgi:uncharacterized membrane protein